MKKKLLKSLILGALLSLSTTAFAANPFELVPTSNWTYDAFGNLVQAGVFEGYKDINFSKNQTLTRYELATFVAKAMANESKANTEQKTTIDKLAVEFKGELTNLGVYTSATTPVATPAAATSPATADKIKITGDTRIRYEYTKSNEFSDNVNFRTRFNIDVGLNDTWKFHTRFVNNQNITSYKGDDDGGASTTKVDQTYVKGAIGDVGVTFGKMPLLLGKGSLADTDKYWNGAKVDFGNKVKVQAGYARQMDQKKYFFTDATTSLTKDLDVTAAYLKDFDRNNTHAEYKSWAVGFGYNGLENLAIVGEYGKNDISNAKSWIAGATFRGANIKKVGSWDIGINYRKAAPKFDPEYWSTPDATYAMDINALDDIQGFEYSINYVPVKNAILHLAYGDMENYAGTSDNNRKYAVSSVTFKF